MSLPNSTSWYRNTLALDIGLAGFPETAKDIVALADEVDRLTIALYEAREVCDETDPVVTTGYHFADTKQERGRS